jgi:hypothetical protein
VESFSWTQRVRRSEALTAVEERKSLVIRSQQDPEPTKPQVKRFWALTKPNREIIRLTSRAPTTAILHRRTNHERPSARPLHRPEARSIRRVSHLLGPAGSAERDRRGCARPRPGPPGSESGAEREMPGACGHLRLCSAHGNFPESGKFPRLRVQVPPRTPSEYQCKSVSVWASTSRLPG